MRILFIGGTGNISRACAELAVRQGHEVYLLNRGKRSAAVAGAKPLIADLYDSQQLESALGDLTFDAVAQFIAFDVEQIERDIATFRGRCGQYFFISSASVYQKPLRHPLITESTPRHNPYWLYARRKIACEDRLREACRADRFPAVIVRPSHTYDAIIPTAIGPSDWTVVQRLQAGKPFVIHGDGTSLWTITHSADFAMAFNGLFGNSRSIGHEFHITSDEVLCWNEIYRSIAEAVGVEPRYVYLPSDLLAKHYPAFEGSLLGDKTHSALFDNSKVKQFVPGFQASIPFHEGIRCTIARMQKKASFQNINEKASAQLDEIAQRWAKATDLF